MLARTGRRGAQDQACGISIDQGAVQHIGMPVPALRVIEIGSGIFRIGAGEAPEGCAVVAGLEVIQAEFRIAFLAGELLCTLKLTSTFNAQPSSVLYPCTREGSLSIHNTLHRYPHSEQKLKN